MQIDHLNFLQLKRGSVITLPSDNEQEEKWEVVETDTLPHDPRLGRVSTAVHIMNVEGTLQIIHFYPGYGVTDEEGTRLPKFNKATCRIESPPRKKKIVLPTGF